MTNDVRAMMFADALAMKKPSSIPLQFLGALAFGCASASHAETFAVHEIATGVATHQTILTGSFGGDRVLAAVDVDVAGRHRVQFHGFNGDGWSRESSAPLGLDTLFVDVLSGAGDDRLIAYRQGRVEWFDPASGKGHVLAELPTTYRSPGDGDIPHIDITRDLNRDGRDDLVVPDVDGFRIAVQSPDGSFSDPVKLGPPEPFLEAVAHDSRRMYGQGGITPENVPWYLGRIHELDYDRDGRTDLAFWNGEGFDLYRQNESGTFRTVANRFETDVEFDFDGAYGLAFHLGDTSPVAMVFGSGERMEHRVLKGFRDLDADGTADLIVLALSGRSPLRLRGRFDFHFGRPVPGGTAFTGVPDTTIDVPGHAAGGEPWGYASHRFVDFDGDGDLDAALNAVNTGVGGMLKAIAGNAVSIDLALFRLHGRTFPGQPDATRRVASPFRPLSRRGPLFPAVLAGDINGDGRMDFLIGDRWDELSIFPGTSSRDPFTATPTRIPIDIPAAGDRNVRLADLDGNGRHEIVIHHPSSTGMNRVVVLVTHPADPTP